ncbi:hypothetical protein DCU91_003168 [Salmonella enterica subsp. enterica]|uniref:Ead/Ea22-like family protein n=1 Tax=Salmonella enterica TaxID=28901 RepID=A0A622D029_SALER|nr:hypothetical protein [Salmonella enterica subsp. enterica serovar Alachua]EDT2448082.1 hypothetical protein [Salmonella enterica subsp. enterica]EDU0985645.1 hypothetical protein [Salmonella enterica subsp. enterica]
MKEVKIYTIVSDQLSPPITGESFCTDMVRHSDYAELEAKCAALAGEVAYLRGEIENHSQSTHFCGRCGEADPCITDDVCWSLKHPIPATDAFLAEVRAQGVDSAINTVIAMMNHQHPVTSKAIDIMRVHAYQIRKGVQS